jgi:hypothetical protein
LTPKFTTSRNLRAFILVVLPFSLTQKLVSILFNGVHVSEETLFTFSLAGQDATEAFFGLHRYEVLERPQYQRLQVGVIAGEKSILHGRIPGEISSIPYAEPTWLTPGYHSPYFSEVGPLYSHQELTQHRHHIES